MKKRTIILLIMAALFLVLTVACSDTTRAEDTAVVETTNFRPVEGRDDLMYDIETRVIYYIFNTKYIGSGYGYGYGYMAPYLNENLRYCKYINDQIVEYIPETPIN